MSIYGKRVDAWWGKHAERGIASVGDAVVRTWFGWVLVVGAGFLALYLIQR